MTFGQLLGLIVVFAMVLVPAYAIIMPWASQVPRIGKPLSAFLIILAAAWVTYGVVMR